MFFFLIILVALALGYGALMLWYSLGWKRLRSFIPETKTPGTTSVTVIIPARNEAKNLPDLLHALEQQTYDPKLLEVIIIDDFSTDNTAEIISSSKAPNIHLLRLSDHLDKEERLNSYKKKAIEIAIARSTGELIVTTDADCVMGPKWIETLVHFYELHQPKFIAAPVSFYKEHNLFKRLQSLDFMTMQGITGAVAQSTSGTMCNGANLAYEKRAFYEVGGFKGIDNIASGDDMLLMYKIYSAYPDKVKYLKCEDAVVRTLAVDTISDFMNQRIRWSSKADKYEDKRLTWMLVLVYLFNLGLLVMGCMVIFMPVWRPWFFILLLFKITLELYFLLPVARFFNKTELLVWFIPGQIFHIPYIVIAGWLGKFGSYQWKGRQVN
ncbi:Glycosyltransferase, catalytic subunit of cellulose synthase and poly-beta-1,6-N-acetylglucosamine synthase [Chitinophaga terrae (ex Kim and Jung 2007)]|uniref:Glycosyltransferase, catalytic subunit of cellulose synthase and poly-beta-1,6-N-acetylglucosamine synthase n=1 Tax=Chitinophaga terrae (ex Kim and Jung 2007) TaxID=408074 RepID=A0A1H3XWV3_9BACT|nr:glycosyltransferase [Chitinophaga terrae (ex Kim and Jung 2007)]MDQ0105725.1 cellulose synthase/poly-beta-1,6-N-acetylglucosamine synthase-like glycosyltransferase [Chitinophaga terrae (ex Kim and Jung 2007)]GEP89398.1 glycosyl transferase [Chitinophaga terrae (ex Kim and Jung 2007)]SEA03032.1 Glycosyltransferase, catalytic subunit of cellulose synthase and poly-beta-1,6-N-acetylglucosamine synthase [Chitinophaga terrae (ex Kim and Jung 2007)]